MSIEPTTLTARPVAWRRALPDASRRALSLVGAPGLVALVFVAATALTWAAWGDLSHDTGYDFVAADRVAHGQLPYVDFPYVYGPLGVGVLGAAFAVLGSNVGAAIALGLALAAAAVALTYRLARELTAPAGAAIAAVLAIPAALGTGNIGLVLPHSTSASVAVVASLLGLLAAAAYARTGARSRLAAAGVALGAVALTRPEFVVALAGALALWLTMRALRAEGSERRRALGDGALCGALAAAIPLVVYGAFAAKVGLGELRQDLFPSAQLAAGGRAVLEANAPMTVASLAKLAGRLLLYAGGVAALVGAGILAARGGRPRQLVLAATGLATIGLLGALAGNPDAVRAKLSYAYEWIPAGAALGVVALCWTARRRDRAWRAQDQVALLVTAFLAILAAKTYAAFLPQPNPDFAQYATYALPFAAIFLVWLHLEALPAGSGSIRALGYGWLGALALAGCVLVAGDARDETVTVSGPGGSLAAPAAQGAAYQGALDAILARTQPGDPVLLAPQLSALYTLSGRSDPLSQISLLPGALATARDERAAIERLRDVRVAVIDRRHLTEYGQGAFGETFDRRLGAWLRDEFRRVATLRGAGNGAVNLEIWQRSAR